jgi:putative membrane protein
LSIEATLLADTWGMHGDVGWGWMTLMMIGMVVFWGAVIFGIVWLVRGTTQSGPTLREGQVGRESPVEILERRFAEGALSSEDYWARRQVLVNGTVEPNGRTEEPLTVPRSEGASES